MLKSHLESPEHNRYPGKDGNSGELLLPGCCGPSAVYKDTLFCLPTAPFHRNPLVWLASCPQWVHPKEGSGPGCLVWNVVTVASPLPWPTAAFQDALIPRPSCREHVYLPYPHPCRAGMGLIMSLLDQSTCLPLPAPSPAFPTVCPCPHPPSTGQPGDHSSANLALFLPWFTAFPWLPTLLRVASTPFLSFQALPGLSPPSLPGLLSIITHCGQISKLIKMYEHLEKRFIGSKICKEGYTEANQHLIMYPWNTSACLFHI